MIISKPQGRTGNLLLQNIGMSILSSKFDIKVSSYSNIRNQDILGLNLHSGGRIIDDYIEVYDNRNHMEYLEKQFNTDISKSISLPEILEKKQFNYGISYDGTFQVKEFVLDYRSEILNHFNLQFSDQKGVFVHVRLGDVIGSNPGFDYYKKSLSSISFIDGYISSDTPNHPIVQNLISEFNLKLFTQSDPITIINFAKDFDNLVLSKGTFSWWIAFLSKSKNIIFPKNDLQWYGDIFVYDDWNYIDIKI